MTSLSCAREGEYVLERRRKWNFASRTEYERRRPGALDTSARFPEDFLGSRSQQHLRMIDITDPGHGSIRVAGVQAETV